MTRFTVTWHREAEDDLAELWLSGTDRNEISAAVQAIDLALSSEAEPLRVLYSVLEADRVVQVELVRRI